MADRREIIRCVGKGFGITLFVLLIGSIGFYYVVGFSKPKNFKKMVMEKINPSTMEMAPSTITNKKNERETQTPAIPRLTLRDEKIELGQKKAKTEMVKRGKPARPECVFIAQPPEKTVDTDTNISYTPDGYIDMAAGLYNVKSRMVIYRDNDGGDLYYLCDNEGKPMGFSYCVISGTRGGLQKWSTTKLFAIAKGQEGTFIVLGCLNALQPPILDGKRIICLSPIAEGLTSTEEARAALKQFYYLDDASVDEILFSSSKLALQSQ